MNLEENELSGGEKKVNRRLRRLRLPAVVAVLAVAVLAAFVLRYDTTVVDGGVLVIDRWADGAMLVESGGKVSHVEGTGPVTRRFFLSSKKLADWGEARVRVRAVWQWGKSHALVVVSPVPEELNQARMNRENFFHLAFTDRNGFTIYQFDVPLHRMHAVTDQAGAVLALEYRRVTSLPRRQFRAVRRWMVR